MNPGVSGRAVLLGWLLAATVCHTSATWAADISAPPFEMDPADGHLELRIERRVEVRIFGPHLSLSGVNYGTLAPPILSYSPGKYRIELSIGGRILWSEMAILRRGVTTRISWPRKAAPKKMAPLPVAAPVSTATSPKEEEWPGRDGILALLDGKARPRKPKHSAQQPAAQPEQQSPEPRIQKPESFYVLYRSAPPELDLPLGIPFPPFLPDPNPNARSSESRRKQNYDREHSVYETMQRVFLADAEFRAYQNDLGERIKARKALFQSYDYLFFVPLIPLQAWLAALTNAYGTDIDHRERQERIKRDEMISLFESFRVTPTGDKRWLPLAIFRLAQLRGEHAFDLFLTAMDAYQKALDSPTPPTGEPPRPDYKGSIALYRNLIAEFPSIAPLDAVFYFLALALEEMGDDDAATRTFLALTCRNRHKGLEDSRPNSSPARSNGSAFEDVYKGCQPLNTRSRYLAESWLRVGEKHFDAAELESAVSAYSRVLEFGDGRYYEKALYKLAWSHYRANRFAHAVTGFDALVKWSDLQKTKGDPLGSDMRPEAVQYLGVCFAEPDWDGDTRPDKESGLQRIEAFYKGREGEPQPKEVFQRLGDIYYDLTRYREAIAVYERTLAMWPYEGGAPIVQDRIVRAHERSRNPEMAGLALELLGTNYAPGTEWHHKNRSNTEALTVAKELSGEALLRAATTVHASAQECRRQGGEENRTALLECKRRYNAAARLYEKNQAGSPNSTHTRKYRSYYADALFYGGRYAEAGAVYSQVRDSSADRRSREDAALDAVIALQDAFYVSVSSSTLALPEMLEGGVEGVSGPPLPLPPLAQQLMVAYDSYAKVVPYSRKVAEFTYRTATLLVQFRHFGEARKRLEALYERHCREEVAVLAARMLALTYESRGEGTGTAVLEQAPDGTVCPGSRDDEVARS